MAASCEALVFRKTKGDYNACDPEMWDDDALTKAYDTAVSKSGIEDVEMPVSEISCSNQSDVMSEETENQECSVGEIVWSRTPGVTVTLQNNERSVMNTNTPKSKRKNKKKKGKNLTNGKNP